MNRNFIFALALLATIFVVNAIPHQLYKRTTTFGTCPEFPADKAVLNVTTLSPDPVVAGKTDDFTMTGIFTKDVTTDTQVSVVFGAPAKIDPIFLDKICDYTKCPIPAGTEMTVKVPVPVPASLPTKNYVINVVILDTFDILGCALATV